MSTCPFCSEEIAAETSQCPSCGAEFIGSIVPRTGSATAEPQNFLASLVANLKNRQQFAAITVPCAFLGAFIAPTGFGLVAGWPKYPIQWLVIILIWAVGAAPGCFGGWYVGICFSSALRSRFIRRSITSLGHVFSCCSTVSFFAARWIRKVLLGKKAFLEYFFGSLVILFVIYFMVRLFVEINSPSVSDRSLLLRLRAEPPRDGVSFSPDGKRIVSAGGTKALRVWDAQTGQKMLTIQTPQQFMGFNSVRLSPDGSRIASSGYYHIGDNQVSEHLSIWDAQSGQEIIKFDTGFSDDLWPVHWSPDGKRIAGAVDNVVTVWDAQTGQEILVRYMAADADYVCWSPDGKRIAVSVDNVVRVLNAQTNQEMLKIQIGWFGCVTSCMSFSPDGKWIAIADSHCKVRVWDAQTGRENLISRHATKTRFDSVTGEEKSTHKWIHRFEVICVSWSPDGNWIVSGGLDSDRGAFDRGYHDWRSGTIKVWSFQTGELLRYIESRATNSSITSVSFSPDGKRIVSGSDGVIEVWTILTPPRSRWWP